MPYIVNSQFIAKIISLVHFVYLNYELKKEIVYLCNFIFTVRINLDQS